jgi:hypothetical protein
MPKNTFEDRLKKLVNETVANELIQKGMDAYNALTDSERDELDREDNYRFPKILLNAITESPLLDKIVLGSEGAKKELAKTKRILRKRGKL